MKLPGGPLKLPSDEWPRLYIFMPVAFFVTLLGEWLNLLGLTPAWTGYPFLVVLVIFWGAWIWVNRTNSRFWYMVVLAAIIAAMLVFIPRLF